MRPSSLASRRGKLFGRPALFGAGTGGPPHLTQVHETDAAALPARKDATVLARALWPGDRVLLENDARSWIVAGTIAVANDNSVLALTLRAERSGATTRIHVFADQLLHRAC